MGARAVLRTAAMLSIAGSAACAGTASPSATPSRRPTFAADIAPILLAHCADCHRPGTPAPFPLLSYDDVRMKAEDIARAVGNRHMPPWSAAPPPASAPLRNERRLTDRQIAAFQTWIDRGLPSGDLRRAPQPPSHPASWPLGLPDLTLSLPRALRASAGSTDVYRTVTVPMRIPVDRLIAAIDYQPGTPDAVRQMAIVAVPEGREAGDYDALPGLGGLLGTGSLEFFGDQVIAADRDSRDLGVWVPGVPARRLPDGLAYRLPARSNLVLQFSLHAGDVDVVEDGLLAVYFADATPRVALADLQVPPALGLAAGIDLPAGGTPVRIEDAFTLPVALDVHGARGHAHDRAREFTLTVTLPNGRTERLLHLDRWDVRFQDTYLFAKPVHLPAGAVVRVAITYDPAAGASTAGPARRVVWGRQPTNEVGAMTLVVASPSPTDAATLADARAAHLREQLRIRRQY